MDNPQGNQGESIEDVYSQYRDKIRQQLDPNAEIQTRDGIISKEYVEFKTQYMPVQLSIYEKACNLAEKLVKIAPDKKKKEELEESLSIAHLNVTATGVMSFSILFPIFFMFAGGILSFILLAILTGQGSLFISMFFVIGGLLMIVPLGNLPFIIANNWRLKASNQMVLCVFYVVSYMRHTSNLELAIKFTTDHLSPPLSLDLKKVLWNVETEKYESVRESLENYLQTWRKWNMEFIEGMHLIEASLYESSEDRRIEELEKALSLILEETYEKMLHYAHDLQSPINMLHMLGIILPILGLVILPLVASFMESVRWYHISMLYNVSLPIAVFYLSKMILSKRPSGYGETVINLTADESKKLKSIVITIGEKEILISPLVLSIIIGSLFFFIGISPILIHSLTYSEGQIFDIVMTDKDKIVRVEKINEIGAAKFSLLGYRQSQDGHDVLGPYGLGASVLSLFVTLGAAYSIGIYYKMTTKKLVKLREESKKLEGEFAAALFQLGSRIGDGIPAEIAFEKVAQMMRDTNSGKFFEIVSMNISKLGMGVEKALFDPRVGAITKYPSNLIQSSMEVFIEAAKKGPKIASQALINISLYIKEMHNVDERLKDLLAETISSMQSQIKFLTPAISGIVIGITSMITAILGKLSYQIHQMNAEAGGATGGVGVGTELIQMFGDSIPTYYFQIIVGLYVVQIIYILTMMVNTIENGLDKLNEKHMIANNLLKSTTMYVMISFVVMLIFNLVAGAVLGGMTLV